MFQINLQVGLMQQALDANHTSPKAAVEANGLALKAKLEAHNANIKEQLVIQQRRATNRPLLCDLSTPRPEHPLLVFRASSAPSWRTAGCRLPTLPAAPLTRSPHLSRRAAALLHWRRR